MHSAVIVVDRGSSVELALLTSHLTRLSQCEQATWPSCTEDLDSDFQCLSTPFKCLEAIWMEQSIGPYQHQECQVFLYLNRAQQYCQKCAKLLWPNISLGYLETLVGNPFVQPGKQYCCSYVAVWEINGKLIEFYWKREEDSYVTWPIKLLIINMSWGWGREGVLHHVNEYHHSH